MKKRAIEYFRADSFKEWLLNKFDRSNPTLTNFELGNSLDDGDILMSYWLYEEEIMDLVEEAARMRFGSSTSMLLAKRGVPEDGSLWFQSQMVWMAAFHIIWDNFEMVPDSPCDIKAKAAK